MNEAVKLGIEATNNARQVAVTAAAQQKIAFILEERAKIASYEKSKAMQQETLNKLTLDVVTYKSVTGSDLPANPNHNQATVIKAIEAMNANKQASVKAASQALIDTIAGYDKSIAATSKRIGELIEEMNKLAVEEVTAAQVVG